MTQAPSPSQLKAELAHVLEREPTCRLVAWHSAPGYLGPPELEVHGHRFEVVSPRSPLEFHQLAVQAERGLRRLACLVTLDQHQLSTDLLRRLPRKRLLSLDAWSAVRQRFHAYDLDSRLRREQDLASLLLEAEPPEGFAPALGGVLTCEHAWSYLLPHLYQLPPDAADPVRLLRWSLRAEMARLPSLPPERLKSLESFLEMGLSELAAPWVHVLRDSIRDMVPLGLVCDVLYAEPARGTTIQAGAAARLENRIGGRALSQSAGQSWARLAAQAMEPQDPRILAPLLARAEELLDDLGGSALAVHSNVLPSGFRLRLQGLAERPEPGSLIRVLEHRQARLEPERAERAAMALRLHQWLESPVSPAGPELARQLEWYCEEGHLVDRARDRVFRGDPEERFNRFCRDLFERASARRLETTRSFAQALQGSHLAGSLEPLLGVEGFLEQVLTPLLKQTRALVLVLDGCSQSVLSELLEDLPSLGLSSYVHERHHAMISMLPSVTEVSRTSLLSGKVLSGDAEVEKRHFSSLRKDAALFHRREVLDAQGGLQPDLVRKVESSQARVVGVVLNAIDDTLAKDDQLELTWRLPTIGPLAALLTLAQRADRAVLLVSDHGHVLEQGTRPEGASGGGERWLVPEGECGPDWMDFRGPRLLQPLRLACTETVRVGLRKNGYHGGATPREVVCALRLVALPGKRLSGWQETSEPRPAWWEWSQPILLPAPVAPSPKSASGQLQLFEGGASLTTRLMDSQMFRQQCRTLSVSITQLAPLEAMLELLTRVAPPVPVRLLAQQLDRPESRVRDDLALAVRLLNLDGYAILTLDGQQVALDRDRLEELFELTEGKVSQLAVMDRSGRRAELRLPFALEPPERTILELLARHGRLSEGELVKATRSRRIGGVAADLCTRLHDAGWIQMVREGSGEQGEVYSLRMK